MTRRLPVYLLLDTSGSMVGEPIEAVNNGLQVLVNSLRQNPYALETVWLSVITFDSNVKQLIPLTGLENFSLPRIDVPQSGATFLGKALELLCTCCSRELLKNTKDSKGDWMPLLFIMTDGNPSDIGLYREMISLVKLQKFSTIVACAAGTKVNEVYLRELTSNVVSLDTADSSTIGSFFKWVSNCVNVGSQSVGATIDTVIPPPPTEINIVF